jgi:hypothetical protein
MVKPVVNNIIAVYGFNKRQPIVAGKSDEKHTAVKWDSLFYWHRIKITQRVGFL